MFANARLIPQRRRRGRVGLLCVMFLRLSQAIGEPWDERAQRNRCRLAAIGQQDVAQDPQHKVLPDLLPRRGALSGPLLRLLLRVQDPDHPQQVPEERRSHEVVVRGLQPREAAEDAAYGRPHAQLQSEAKRAATEDAAVTSLQAVFLIARPKVPARDRKLTWTRARPAASCSRGSTSAWNGRQRSGWARTG